MWTNPYTWKEGCCIGGGLLAVGMILQWVVGEIEWSLMAWPVNGIMVALLLILLVVLHLLRDRLYIVRYLATSEAAIPSILFSAALTLVMGITGWMSMLRFWPLVLCYLWMVIIMGLAVLKRLSRIRSWNKSNIVKNLAFLTNHLGLMLALVAATAGSADMHRLKMSCQEGQVEWRAMDEESKAVVELPLAIELSDFMMEQYPPQVVFINNETGKKIETNLPLHTDSIIEFAAPVDNRYVEWHSMGATTAAYVHAGDTAGWVSNGSFMFPFAALRVNDSCSAVMTEPEPKRYASEVIVYTQSGLREEGVIEVNHPLQIEGWKIYQFNYDTEMGRWSTTSIFELVRDPWLPAVYAGLIMMVLGAIFMFIFAGENRLTKSEAL